MTRSKSSLLRRAEKRGVSLKEQKKKDRNVNVKLTVQTGAETSEKTAKIKPQPPKFSTWHCLFCKNDNFDYRVDCNRCMREKSLSCKEFIKNNKVKSEDNKSINISSVSEQSPSNTTSWKEQAPPEKIIENATLLSMYLKAVEEGSLEKLESHVTEDQFNRAKILYERKIRRSFKKNQRSKKK